MSLDMITLHKVPVVYRGRAPSCTLATDDTTCVLDESRHGVNLMFDGNHGNALPSTVGIAWVARPRFLPFHTSDIPNTESMQSAKLSFL